MPTGTRARRPERKTTMTRAERSKYTYIKNSLKGHDLGPGCQLTIRTDASREYKQALKSLYEA